MPADFHHLAPVILTESLFETYQPELTVKPQEPQYNAAFLIAEQQMVKALSTPMSPSTVTGTFSMPMPYDRIMLPHTYVRSVDNIVAYALNDGCTCDMIELTACAILRNNYGYIDTRVIAGYYVGGCGQAYRPEFFDIEYTAGLPTGTAANDASLHMALAMLSRVELLEMLDPGALEGGAGDPGVTSYSTLGYSESRSEKAMKMTPFGTSAIANRAWKLVEHLYIPRPLKFGG